MLGIGLVPLALAAVFGFAVLRKPKGDGFVPMLTVPAPWDRMTATGQSKQVAKSGREYFVTTWPPDARGRIFTIAISRFGDTIDPNFGISFIQSPMPGSLMGERTVHQIRSTDPAGAEAMTRDWI